MQVLKGSHRMGRIEHIRVGDQVGADTERVEQIMKVLLYSGTSEERSFWDKLFCSLYIERFPLFGVSMDIMQYCNVTCCRCFRWCKLSWSQETPCSSTPTCSIAANRTRVPNGGGPSSWPTTEPPTTQSKSITTHSTHHWTK